MLQVSKDFLQITFLNLCNKPTNILTQFSHHLYVWLSLVFIFFEKK